MFSLASSWLGIATTWTVAIPGATLQDEQVCIRYLLNSPTHVLSYENYAHETQDNMNRCKIYFTWGPNMMAHGT
jgi:hypothetical protein